MTEADIKVLTQQFEDAINESSLMAQVESTLEDMIERNSHEQQVLVIYEREIPEIRKQIDELTRLESNLKHIKCDFYLANKSK